MSIRLLRAELDPTNREVMALTLELEQRVEAYEELRRTQQAIMQQEAPARLGADGERPRPRYQ